MTTSQESTPTARAVSPDSGTHWTEEGAWQVAPGIYRIPLPLPMDGLRAVNVYAIETESGLTLIDGGWAIEASRTVLDRSLATISRTVHDIRSFLVTHVHRDHYTQAVVLGREVGSHVSLGLAEKPSLDRLQQAVPGESHHTPVLVRSGARDIAERWAAEHRDERIDPSLWGYPDAWLEGDHQIAVGQRALDAVSTPGHTQGHYVFADQSAGLLFAGDHVLPTITPSIGFEGANPVQPLGDFMASLTKVRGLPDLRVLPAHGPVGMSSHERVDQLLGHHEHRLEQCLAAFSGDRGLTAHDVAKTLPWTRHERAFETLDLFNSALATMETRAHLLLLVARGRLRSTEGDGHDVYRLSGPAAS
ncbi:MBL fold metallo-hydrolase [Ornithinimicrobium sp. F0845]|uniref:MBL fold metallo-hydrolase n=1 Tax=Ornithinimicrobium sp. F0845 TaxID=2926412 RepID=UPI001FF61F92|nr:MBL fold metallo-hydrolase [Ornithinimicrobium sp. F0845]MCK0112612.1 MBL fold metallo-hydrolase [Ornithinimicrobium sp. F0845]